MLSLWQLDCEVGCGWHEKQIYPQILQNNEANIPWNNKQYPDSLISNTEISTLYSQCRINKNYHNDLTENTLSVFKMAKCSGLIIGSFVETMMMSVIILCHINVCTFCSLKSKYDNMNKKKSLFIPGLSVLCEIHCIRYIICWIMKKRAVCDSRFPTVNFQLIYRYTMCWQNLCWNGATEAWATSIIL